MDMSAINGKLDTQRTKNYFLQVRNSFIYKFLAIVLSYLSIPLMIKYLGNVQYGIWSTLLSIMSWISLFDIGIGNGLRNKVSESLAKGEIKKVQLYISTAYTIIGAISLILILFFIFVNNFIPWNIVFNTSVLPESELKSVVNITVVFMLAYFCLSLINQVFNGLQKTSMVVFNQFLSNLLALIFIFLLYSYFERSLFKLAFAYGFSMVISNFILSLWFYSKNKELIPKIQNFNKKYLHVIVSLGFKFFVIQIAVIVIFTTDKIMITQLFGPEYVTSYDVLFKLFSVITLVHSLLMAPLWPAYSDAYHRGDLIWIKKTLINQLKIYILFVMATIALGFMAKPIIRLWIGKDIFIDNMLIFAMIIFILISTWSNVFAYFVNATNKIGVQMGTSVVAIIINIPLAYTFVKFLKMEVYGIVLATCVSLSFFAILGPIQTFKILLGGK
jgi:O-antigen/teichoic acid export membrane protein